MKREMTMGYGLVFLAPAHADFLTGIPQMTPEQA